MKTAFAYLDALPPGSALDIALLVAGYLLVCVGIMRVVDWIVKRRDG